jgi:hypothetical protein
MANKIEKLIRLLEDATELLRSHGVNGWADWLSRDVEYLKKRDFYGIKHLLSAFGGMGSFNDVIICPENEHNILESDVERVNQRLDELQNEIYLLAKQIKKETWFGRLKE